MMKPNILGGQTFESTPEELGILRNTLLQARCLVNSTTDASIKRGDSPLYRHFWKSVGGFDGYFSHKGLRQSIQGITADVFTADRETTDGYSATVGETEVIIGCLRWITNSETKCVSNTVSAEQKEHARQMLNHFDGVTPEA